MPVGLTAEDEALAARLREWRAAEAKRLRVPAYVVMHDRTLTALGAGAAGESEASCWRLMGWGRRRWRSLARRFGDVRGREKGKIAEMGAA